jgi:hypothetical protein
MCRREDVRTAVENTRKMFCNCKGLPEGMRPCGGCQVLDENFKELI